MSMQSEYQAAVDRRIVLTRWGTLRKQIEERMPTAILDVLAHKDVGQPENQAQILTEFLLGALEQSGRADITITSLEA